MPTKKITCRSCSNVFVIQTGQAGRPATLCEKCRRPRGVEREHAANRARFNARRREVRRSKAAEANTAELGDAAELAVALSIFPDAESAAQFLGLDVDQKSLAALERIARRDHAGVVKDDRAELARRLRAVQHLCAIRFMRSSSQIAPRDLGHAARSFAHAYFLLGGDKKMHFAPIQLFVLGADGKPFDPNAEPQPVIGAPPDETTH